MTFTFDHLHPTTKHAYIDGLLCGMIVAYLAREFYNEHQETKALKKYVAEEKAKSETHERIYNKLGL